MLVGVRRRPVGPRGAALALRAGLCQFRNFRSFGAGGREDAAGEEVLVPVPGLLLLTREHVHLHLGAQLEVGEDLHPRNVGPLTVRGQAPGATALTMRSLCVPETDF